MDNKWIPISKRLPEENGHYLVTYHEWGGELMKRQRLKSLSKKNQTGTIVLRKHYENDRRRATSLIKP